MTSISYVSSDTNVTGSAATTNDSANDTDTSLSEEKQIFLEILLTQLENQNPLDPVDTTEFTNQLVSYSSLEQEMEANDNLEKVIDALNSANTFSSMSYLGADVDINSQATVMQDGEAKWSYALKEDAENVTIQIVNANNETLAAYGAEDSAAGTYDITITNDDLASAVAGGEAVYLVVAAVDSEGEQIETEIISTVKVDSVESSDNEVILTAGNISFSIEDVISLRLDDSDNSSS